MIDLSFLSYTFLTCVQLRLHFTNVCGSGFIEMFESCIYSVKGIVANSKAERPSRTELNRSVKNRTEKNRNRNKEIEYVWFRFGVCEPSRTKLNHCMCDSKIILLHYLKFYVPKIYKI